ncbi:hypothetical protein BC938DRAFT_473094 [Jimgerdemannia flammicorona]|uniref:Up-regulated during septation protein 1 domain-containing protein n=1 Tax=Jimgerdemannia flammicorona TaxID=994334 RepID=A0A433Q4L6_9FUNG|nr:hypothetical protein BC938DRAFT_473094 [Jimgerdemannia flammicorona]
MYQPRSQGSSMPDGRPRPLPSERDQPRPYESDQRQLYQQRTQSPQGQYSPQLSPTSRNSNTVSAFIPNAPLFKQFEQMQSPPMLHSNLSSPQSSPLVTNSRLPPVDRPPSADRPQGDDRIPAGDDRRPPARKSSLRQGNPRSVEDRNIAPPLPAATRSTDTPGRERYATPPADLRRGANTPPDPTPMFPSGPAPRTTSTSTPARTHSLRKPVPRIPSPILKNRNEGQQSGSARSSARRSPHFMDGGRDSQHSTGSASGASPLSSTRLNNSQHPSGESNNNNGAPHNRIYGTPPQSMAEARPSVTFAIPGDQSDNRAEPVSLRTARSQERSQERGQQPPKEHSPIGYRDVEQGRGRDSPREREPQQRYHQYQDNVSPSASPLPIPATLNKAATQWVQVEPAQVSQIQYITPVASRETLKPGMYDASDVGTMSSLPSPVSPVSSNGGNDERHSWADHPHPIASGSSPPSRPERSQQRMTDNSLPISGLESDLARRPSTASTLSLSTDTAANFSTHSFPTSPIGRESGRSPSLPPQRRANTMPSPQLLPQHMSTPISLYQYQALTVPDPSDPSALPQLRQQASAVNTTMFFVPGEALKRIDFKLMDDLIVAAVADSRDFGVILPDQMLELREEIGTLSGRIKSLEADHARETRFLHSAQNLMKLHEGKSKGKPSKQLKMAIEQVDEAMSKVKLVATELWHAHARMLELQRRHLEHTGGSLNVGMRKLDDGNRQLMNRAKAAEKRLEEIRMKEEDDRFLDRKARAERVFGEVAVVGVLDVFVPVEKEEKKAKKEVKKKPIEDNEEEPNFLDGQAKVRKEAGEKEQEEEEEEEEVMFVEERTDELELSTNEEGKMTVKVPVRDITRLPPVGRSMPVDLLLTRIQALEVIVGDLNDEVARSVTALAREKEKTCKEMEGVAEMVEKIMEAAGVAKAEEKEVKREIGHDAEEGEGRELDLERDDEEMTKKGFELKDMAETEKNKDKELIKEPKNKTAQSTVAEKLQTLYETVLEQKNKYTETASEATNDDGDHLRDVLDSSLKEIDGAIERNSLPPLAREDDDSLSLEREIEEELSTRRISKRLSKRQSAVHQDASIEELVALTERYESELDDQQDEFSARMYEEETLRLKIERQLEESQLEVAQLRGMVSDLELLVRQKQRSLDDRDGMVTKLEEEMDEREKELFEKEEELDQLRREVEHKTMQIENKERELEDLGEVLERKQKELDRDKRKNTKENNTMSALLGGYLDRSDDHSVFENSEDDRSEYDDEPMEVEVESTDEDEGEEGEDDDEEEEEEEEEEEHGPPARKPASSSAFIHNPRIAVQAQKNWV